MVDKHVKTTDYQHTSTHFCLMECVRYGNTTNDAVSLFLVRECCLKGSNFILFNPSFVLLRFQAVSKQITRVTTVASYSFACSFQRGKEYMELHIVSFHSYPEALMYSILALRSLVMMPLLNRFCSLMIYISRRLWIMRWGSRRCRHSTFVCLIVFYSPVSPLCFAVKGLGLPLIILICVH